MKNAEVAELLRGIAELLEVQNDNPFKIRAYVRAALTIETLSEDIETVHKQGRLREVEGVGIAISEKIAEFLDKGAVKYYDDLKKETPLDIFSLRKIPGLGPKTIKKLYDELGIKDVPSLKIAAEQGKIRTIKGLGPKVEENLLLSLSFSTKNIRHQLLVGLQLAEAIKGALSSVDSVQRLEIAGSARRRKDTIGDLDLLAISSNPKEVMDIFAALPIVRQVLAKGSTKCSVRMRQGIQADLRIVDKKSYGAALLYFTGSQQHNIALRKIALSKGYKLNEYGLFDLRENMVAGHTEEEIYSTLGMDYIEPELREDEGEIDLAKQHRLPSLVSIEDIKGDLHVHTTWSDGNESIEEMALACKKLGYEYVCITDHGGDLKIANAMDEKRMRAYIKEIDSVNNRIKGITVLKGVEANITDEGTVDVPNSLLKQLDVVIASVHSGLSQEKKTITKRILGAMDNEYVTIIGHPTGRKINGRKPSDIDFDVIFDKAKSTDVRLEINSFPDRLDLRDVHVRQAISKGVGLSIGTDAHGSHQLQNIRLGVYMGRRGWAQKKDILNTHSLKDLVKKLG